MTSGRRRYYRWLYGAGAVYDLVLGVIFLFFGRWAFDRLDIADKYPEGGFLPLIGAFVLVLGVGYALIWVGDLHRNIDLVAVGALYKLAYTGVGIWISVADEVPHAIFFWGFGVADAVFFVLMAECWLYLLRSRREGTATVTAATPM